MNLQGGFLWTSTTGSAVPFIFPFPTPWVMQRWRGHSPSFFQSYSRQSERQLLISFFLRRLVAPFLPLFLEFFSIHDIFFTKSFLNVEFWRPRMLSCHQVYPQGLKHTYAQDRHAADPKNAVKVYHRTLFVNIKFIKLFVL